MAVLNNILAGAAGQTGGAGGYTIERSLRFNSDDSAHLSRTPSVEGNRRTWTWAGWVKRSALTTALYQSLFANNSGANAFLGFVNGGDGLLFYDSVAVAGGNVRYTSNLLRDPSAWYHVVFNCDTTKATASERARIYVNGTEASYSVANDPALNSDLVINSTIEHQIGGQPAVSRHFSGYLVDIHFIDGQALDPTDFGEFDDNGVWQPIAYTGTYGTNGFHLDFSDNTNTTTIAEDSSGNGNDWTANNISVTAGAGNDSLFDSPTNGTQTDTGAGGEVSGNYCTLNPLTPGVTGLSNGNLDAASANAYPTIIPGSGSWYYEVDGTGYNWDGTFGSWTPRAGSHNFGQRPFSSTAPSGFKALCTANLDDPTIADSSTAMDVVTYTGNGTSQTISGLNLSPDLVWIKNRSQTDPHSLYDTIRGATKRIVTNSTAQESSNNNSLTAFTSDGFSVGSLDAVNGSSEALVAWTWDGGTSTVSNTDGSTTANVRANASTGFSIVSYTGTSANATVGHGLNAAPEFIIIKNRDRLTEWAVYHAVLGATQHLKINRNYAAQSVASYFNNTAPTSSVVSLGGAVVTNYTGEDIIAYCFAPVEGYSAFGSYTGNGSSDGPFVYTGFRPAFVMYKRTDSTSDWYVDDYQRDGYNFSNKNLLANLNNVESGGSFTDFLSNGFKLRLSSSARNASGGTYIYAAFAENPFKTARAR